MPNYRIDERPLRGRDLPSRRKSETGILRRPFFSFLFPTEKMRARSLPIFFRTVFAHMGPKDGSSPCAMNVTRSSASPRGRRPEGTPSELASSWRRCRVDLGNDPRGKSFSDGFKYMSALTNAHTKDAQWYLMVLCADPSDQRSGVGTMLLEQALADVTPKASGPISRHRATTTSPTTDASVTNSLRRFTRSRVAHRITRCGVRLVNRSSLPSATH